MESPHEIYRPLSKRKQIDDKISRACKAPRSSVECGPSYDHSCQCCSMRPNPADNCLNFLNSGVPRRIMFYNYGEWLDFPNQVNQNLIINFKNEKSCSKITVWGQSIFIDLLSMTMVNLKTKKQHSVAWIDEADKSFFPHWFYDGKADDYNELACGVMNGRPQERVGPPKVVKQVIREKGSRVSQKHASMEILKMRIENVPRDSRDFLFVQDTFLSGMHPFATAENILHIHCCVQKDVSSRIALEVFESQIRATRAECGNANVRYGWFGLKKLQIASILIHGFSTVLKHSEEVEADNCICLTPDDRALPDENFASSEACDSDADDYSSPRLYRIWPSQAHTHVHPEYIVAFKLHQNVRDYLFGLKLNPRGHTQKFSTLHHTNLKLVKGPSSPWISLTVLFAEIEDKISPMVKESLYRRYRELKRKAITREDLVKKIRVIIGDKLLLSAFMKNKNHTSSWHGDSVLKSKFCTAVELKSVTVFPGDATKPSASLAKTFFDDTPVRHMVAWHKTISEVVSSNSAIQCQSPDNTCESSGMSPNAILSSERVHVDIVASSTEPDRDSAVKLETDELAGESNGNKK